MVIGNPPYIRQEEFPGLKPYLQEHFETYAGTADLYVYFIELGIRNLKTSGQFTFIVPNKWMRAGYGKALRNFIKKRKINTILDFGDLPVFEEATTYPSILSVQKTKPDETFDALTIESLAFPEGLEKFVAENKADVLVNELQESGWSLTDAKVQKLLAKLRQTGIPLGEYVNREIYRGVLTGLNEAFVIDEATKEKLIAEERNSAEIIKPFLAGRDIKRYKQPKNEKYLIFTRRGINIDKYPAIKNHLLQFREKLEPKPKNFTGTKWKGRKPGSYKWYEIQDAVDYYEEFEKPKVMLPDISTRCEALIDADENFYCVNTAYIIPALSKSDLGILNSKLILFYYSNLVQTIRGGYFRFIRQYLEQIPFIETNKLDEKVTQILALKKQDPTADTSALEAEIDQMVYELYGLTEEEKKVVEGEEV